MDRLEAAIGSVFDRAAATYGTVGPDFFGYFGRRLVDFIGIASSGRVLDLACGTGAALVPAAEAVGAGGLAAGVDLSKAMVRRARGAKNAGSGPPILLACMDAERLGVRSESFDAVVCTFALGSLPDPLSALLEFRCSDLAAELALMHYRAGVEVTIKRDGTPVTEADRAVEHLLRESIGAAVPEDALLGEEFGRLGDSERVWILDPIDGTSFFSRRDPNWRVHIAFEASGRTEVAVVTAPALGRQWWATRGGGAFESSWPRLGDEARLSVTSTSIMKEAVLDALDDDSRGRLPREATIAPPSPLALVELVRGEIDGFLAECCHVWDHAPWILLVEEAGGRFTDRTGGHGGDAGGGLYSNSGLHTELLAAIGYPTRP